MTPRRYDSPGSGPYRKLSNRRVSRVESGAVAWKDLSLRALISQFADMENCLEPTVNTQLAINISEVALDGMKANVHLFHQVMVAAAFHEQVQELKFSLSQISKVEGNRRINRVIFIIEARLTNEFNRPADHILAFEDSKSWDFVIDDFKF